MLSSLYEVYNEKIWKLNQSLKKKIDTEEGLVYYTMYTMQFGLDRCYGLFCH